MIVGNRTRNAFRSLRRRTLPILNEQSQFKTTVELVVCAHKLKGHGENATLMIYRVRLNSPQTSRFRSARWSFTFTTRDPGQTPTSTEALAWAPFNTQDRLAPSDVDFISSLGGSFGVEVSGKEELVVGKKWESDFKQKFYGSAESHPQYNKDTGAITGVEWNIAEAKQQQGGIPAGLPCCHRCEGTAGYWYRTRIAVHWRNISSSRGCYSWP